MKSSVDKHETIEFLRSLGGIRVREFSSPVGKIHVFGNDESLALVSFVKDRNAEAIAAPFENKTTAQISAALSFLENYFKKIASPLPRMELSGFTEKERAVYRALCKIPFGKTIGYGELAARSGVPRGARFAGNAMAKNAFPILIPCHRVIQSSGAIGNYTGGVAIKEFLLRHEGLL